jgi:hypothetical protein
VQKTNSSAVVSVSDPAGPSGTNSEVAITAPDSLGDEAEEAKPPPVDVELAEAGRIMMDYLSLLPKDSPLLATQVAPTR